MDLSSSPALPGFRSELLEAPPRALAARLYGPGWQSSVTGTDNGGWRTRRQPKAVYLVPLIEPLLRGRVMHDGRAPAQSRQDGWLARVSPSEMHPISVRSIARAIHDVIVPILNAAKDQEWKAERTPAVTSVYGTATRPALSDAKLRTALIEALVAYLAADGDRNAGSIAADLKTSDGFVLTAAAAVTILREYLPDALELSHSLVPGARVPPGEVVAAFQATGCPLPQRTILKALPAIFGPQRVNQGYRYYEMPVDIDDPAAS